ncbi:MAG: Trk system potassium transporter TrkA [Oscillospiraceae bacterium]|nr:Trk system potassium transporter TrkA [Oscillospiraceae bacterium]
MNIIIVGSGKVGFFLAEQLVKEKHDITIIDFEDEALGKAYDSLDIMTIKGNGVSPTVLEEAGAANADVVIAATSEDEVNMVCCLTAKQLGAKYTIARIRNPEYNDSLLELKKNLKIDVVINPENAAAAEVARLLRFPAAANIDTFCRGRVELMSFVLQEGDFLIGKPLFDLPPQVKKLQLLFCVADRNGDVCIPKGSFVPQAGDKLYIIGQPSGLDKFFRLLGRYTPKIKKVFLVGGGKISAYLIELLRNMNIRLKVVDKNEQKCRDISAQFPDVITICGDGSDHELLEEENLKSYDAFVALTGRDEDNLIISLYAMQQGVPKTITKCNRQNYISIARTMGLNSIISAKSVTASHILHLIRGMQNSQGSVMNSLHRIADGGAEALEFKLDSTTKNLGVPLKDLKLKPEVLLAVIVRGRTIIIPEGTTTMEADDTVIIISHNGMISEFDDIYLFDSEPNTNGGSI